MLLVLWFLFRNFFSFTFDLVTRTTFWNTVIGILILWTYHVGFSQSCVQRLVALPSLKLARRSMIYFFFGVALIMTFMCGTGITMYAYYHDCDPVRAKIITKYDKLMPRFVQDVTGRITGMSGKFCFGFCFLLSKLNQTKFLSC